MVDPGGSMCWILVDLCGGYWWIHVVDPGQPGGGFCWSHVYLMLSSILTLLCDNFLAKN